MILLVGINLRPSLAALGPLVDQIQRDTQMSDTQASLLTSLPVLLMGLCLLDTGRVQAALGQRGGVTAGLVALVFAALARWLSPTVSVLLATAVVGGMGIAVVQALMPTIIRSRAGSQTAILMGFYSTAIMGGAALASFAAPRIASAQGWALAMGIWALPALAGATVWWRAMDATEPVAPTEMQVSVSTYPRSWLLLAFFGLGTGAYTLVLAWLPPYYTGLGMSAQDAGSLLSALTLAEVAAGIGVAMAVGRFSDRRPIILLAIGALTAGLLCLSLAPLLLAGYAALLCGLGIGALFPLGLIVAMDHGQDAAQAGRIAGFVQGGGYVLAAVLPVIAGLLRQHLSDLTPAWWLMTALCLVLALMALRLRPGARLS
ncbi:MFS transporter [Novosphingobium sp. 9]|uniref:MFS transporter n=1 Tax=Novosphingobium sp. 9 TaxID=2025349 RepID=UPI0021B5E3DB|nr:MFS transporter [Novosphingobium sp. 9]